ncbi:MAG: hypothetical protein NTW49_03005 [Bacteroidia bacterium]|nr:hypothetical protein [Bacteroidia bacterium]
MILRSDTAEIRIIKELVTNYKFAGEIDSAIYYELKLTKYYPGNIYFKYQLSDLFLQNEDYESVLNLLLPSYKADTSNFYLIMQIANCYYQLDFLDTAKYFYKKALIKMPYEKNAVSRLANISIKENNYHDAMMITNHYLEKDTDNVAILRLNAYIYYLSGYYDTAIVEFKKCISHNEKSRVTKKYLAMSYYKNGDYELSEPYFKEAWNNDSTETEVCFYLGVAANRSGDTDTGLVYLTKSLKKLMPPKAFLSSLYSELADANNSLNRNDTALILYKKALEAKPENYSLLFKIAYQYDFYLHMPHDAYKYYEKYLGSAVYVKLLRFCTLFLTVE